MTIDQAYISRMLNHAMLQHDIHIAPLVAQLRGMGLEMSTSRLEHMIDSGGMTAEELLLILTAIKLEIVELEDP